MLFLTLPLLMLQAAVPPVHPAEPAAATQATDLVAIRGAITSGRLEEASTLLQLFDAQHGGSDGGDAFALARGELAVERGSVLEAEQLVRAVTASGEMRCGVERIRGLAMAERALGDAAIDRLGMVVEDCAPDWRVWRALGTLLAERGAGEASRFAFSQALGAASDRPAVHNDFARALVKLGDLVGAATELQVAIGIDPLGEETRRLLDLVTGMRGFEPERAASDTNELWAQRLADAAQGARQADRPALARALFGRALLVSPRYDERLLAEAKQP